MNKVEFAQALEGITGLARNLASLDILDVEFESGHSLELYVASTVDQQSRGLANLNSIDADGMLFYFDTTSYKPFTVKDMRFNLDIAWYDDKGTLLDIDSVEAGNQTPVYAKYGYRYAIETPQGVLPFSNLKVR